KNNPKPPIGGHTIFQLGNCFFFLGLFGGGWVWGYIISFIFTFFWRAGGFLIIFLWVGGGFV
ncbi:hypothetical protein ACNIU2_26485, partial [Escherichia coli]